MSSWGFSSIIERTVYENGTDKLPTMISEIIHIYHQCSQL